MGTIQSYDQFTRNPHPKLGNISCPNREIIVSAIDIEYSFLFCASVCIVVYTKTQRIANGAYDNFAVRTRYGIKYQVIYFRTYLDEMPN